MPIHLGPMTRRKFLAGTTGAGAVLLLSRWAPAADRRLVDPHRFVLLSDTHVPTDPKKTEGGVNMTHHFRKAVAQVAALETAAAGMILCGDLAHHRGLTTDYRQFAPILQTVAGATLPTHLIVGNHDHRGNLYAVLAEHKPSEPLLVGRHVSIVESPRANWFLLDSLERTNATPGLLGVKQLAWLARALDRHKDKPAIVMAHHDPHMSRPVRPGERPRRLIGLKDTEAMLDLLVARKHVKAYIYGHRHRWSHGTHQGLHLVGLPAVAYVFRKTQASAWVLARLEHTGLSLELRCLDARHAAHGKKIELTWRS